MQKYDFAFVIGSFSVKFPTGGDNVVFQIVKRLIKDKKRCIIILLSPFGEGLETFASCANAKNVIRLEERKRIFVKIFYRCLKVKGFRYLLIFFRKLVKIDYDYLFLQNVDFDVLNFGQKQNYGIKHSIATWWATSYLVANDAFISDQKFYLIQNEEDDESFSGIYSNCAKESYELNLKKIVINQDLYLRFQDSKPLKLKVGADLDFYKLHVPITKRNNKIILMPLRNDIYKGSKFAIETAELLKNKISDVRIIAFGDIRKDKVPSFIEYYYKPSSEKLKSLYNLAAIFVLPSIVEGMGLTALEAMSCGCALVTTNTAGVREFLPKNFDSLVPTEDSKSLFLAIVKLIENEDFRLLNAFECHRFAMNYNYDEMYKSFTNILGDISSEPDFAL